MYGQYEPFVLSSACPYSCAVAAFALRLGGQIDPEFLLQCQILDPKFKKTVDSLKAVPLEFRSYLETIGDQQELFLDMDATGATQFYDPWEFKQHNTWIGSSDQWSSTYALQDDIVIDLI